MSNVRGKLTYANVMATIAVFIALGGGAYAATQVKKNSVGTKQLKANAVTGPKVKDGSLSAADIGGAVNSAVRATTAESAAHATAADSATTAASATRATTADSAATAASATHATSADSAGEASHATNSDQLGGSPSSAYIQASQVGSFILAPHFDHTNFGCPFDQTIWHDSSPETNEATGYWRDPFGVVHLRGFAIRCLSAETTVFTLPAGFRPGKLERFLAIVESPLEKDQVTIASTGAVVAAEVAVGHSVALDGITFKCAPSGSNGCP
jgi:hypothetical protein